jgi:hypothetical protein
MQKKEERIVMNDRVVTVLRTLLAGPMLHKHVRERTGLTVYQITSAFISLRRREYVEPGMTTWHITNKGRAALAELDNPPVKTESPVEVDTRPTLF